MSDEQFPDFPMGADDAEPDCERCGKPIKPSDPECSCGLWLCRDCHVWHVATGHPGLTRMER